MISIVSGISLGSLLNQEKRWKSGKSQGNIKENDFLDFC